MPICDYFIPKKLRGAMLPIEEGVSASFPKDASYLSIVGHYNPFEDETIMNELSLHELGKIPATTDVVFYDRYKKVVDSKKLGIEKESINDWLLTYGCKSRN